MFQRLIPLLTALTLLVPAIGTGAGVNVPEVNDLQQLERQMREEKLPVLLMFSASDCPYCERVKSDYLHPMLKSGDYDDKVIIRRVELDNLATLRDFDGNDVDVQALASRYKVWVTPTLVFLGNGGNQLADKIVGMSTPDFYGSYIDMAINKSLDHIRQPRTADSNQGTTPRL